MSFNISCSKESRQKSTRVQDGVGNPIGSLNGALNVHVEDVHEKIINRHFIQPDSATENPNAPVAVNDYIITVDSTTGFTAGDNVVIKDDSGDVREHVFSIITVTADTSITLSRRVDVAYTTSAIIEKVEVNMNIVGSLASPEVFYVQPPSDEVWHITRVLISMTSSTAMDDSKFGGITALTNGVVLEEDKTVDLTITNWKSNSDIKADMFDVNYSDKAPAGSNGLTGRFTFKKSGAVVKLDGSLGDKLEVYIQDDLTGLDSFEMKAQGHIEE